MKLMLYKILIVNSTNKTMTYATEKVEIMEKKIVNDEIVEVGTGKYATQTFSTEDVEVLKKKYIELLDNYKANQLDVIADMKEIVTVTVEIEGTTTSPSTDNEPTDNADSTDETEAKDENSNDDSASVGDATNNSGEETS